MTEQQLRALVRQALVYHLEAGGTGSARGEARPLPVARPHASHALLALPSVERGSPCVIEPEVACNQCGYCKSYGH